MKHKTLHGARGGLHLDDLPPSIDLLDFYRSERHKAMQWARYHMSRGNERFSQVSARLAWDWHKKVMTVLAEQDEKPTKPVIYFSPMKRVMNTE